MSGIDIRSDRVVEYWEMGYDTINYVLFKNPVSATVIDSVKSVANATLFRNGSTLPPPPPPPKPTSAIESLPLSRFVLVGNPFIRLAGLSGAAAVVLGAYGAHSILLKEGLEERKRVYETANRYHFLHTLALLGVPLCRFPRTAGTCLSLGMLLFCGTCYYDAFTGRTDLRKLTPIGGTFLIFGWLFMVL